MRDLAVAESALRTAQRDQIILALARLLPLNLDFAPPNWKLALPEYIKALADLPPDLMDESIDAWIRTSPKFPKPADLRSMVREELDRRFARRDKLRAEATHLPAPAPRIEDPVERAEMAKRMGELARSLAEWATSPFEEARRPRPHYVEDCVPEEVTEETESGT